MNKMTIVHLIGLILLVINLIISLFLGNIVATVAWFTAIMYCTCVLVSTIKESDEDDDRENKEKEEKNKWEH